MCAPCPRVFTSSFWSHTMCSSCCGSTQTRWCQDPQAITLAPYESYRSQPGAMQPTAMRSADGIYVEAQQNTSTFSMTMVIMSLMPSPTIKQPMMLCSYGQISSFRQRGHQHVCYTSVLNCGCFTTTALGTNFWTSNFGSSSSAGRCCLSRRGPGV